MPSKLEEKNALTLATAWTTQECRQLYRQRFGEVWRSKDKAALIRRLAEQYAADGADVPSEVPGDLPPAELINMTGREARDAIGVVLTNWTQVRDLKKERNQQSKELGGIIAACSKRIAEILEEHSADLDGDRVRELYAEAAKKYRKRQRTEDEKARTAEDFKKRIAAAEGRIDEVFEGFRQRDLPFSPPSDDEPAAKKSTTTPRKKQGTKKATEATEARCG